MPETICAILEHWARARPDADALVFLADGEVESARLTFAELLHASRSIAAATLEHAAAGDRAVILLPPSPEFILSLFGCMLGGSVAVPVAPARKRQTSERLAGILKDADASVVLTTEDLVPAVEAAFDQDKSLGRPAIVVTERVVEGGDDWAPPAVKRSDLAMLQYTSGSTGDPKGVALTHGNLVANQRMICKAFAHDDLTTVVSWLPQYHDMGLIGDTLQPLFLGRPRIFMPHGAFIERPLRWLRAIARHENVTSGGPDFAYDFCVRRITDEQCAGLDLSSWRVAYSGSEPVRAETMERFARKFGRWGFRAEAFLPCFGLAEAALLVTGGPGPGRGVEARVDADALARGTVAACKDGKRVVGCGLAGEGAVVRIIDPETHEPCPPERVGEIWTSGPNVAGGYWRREETSLHTLQARLRGDDLAYLRTGDLGFLRDGELFIVGRMSDKIIVRGRNLHFHDIEQTVQESHPSLEPHAGAAFAVERDGKEALVVVQEVRREDRRRVDADRVPGVVRQVVARSHGINVADFVLVRPGAVLKTTSGKIRRQEMRQRYLSGSLEPIGPSRPAATQRPAEAVEPLLGWLRDYADRRLNSRLMDERRCVPPYVVLDFGNRGLLGLQGPPELGGLGLGHRDTMRVFEQLGAIDQTLALLVGIQNVLGTGPILRSARPATRDELLPRLVAGRELAAFALTEPGAGSNPRAIRARAVPAGQGRWRLHGTKSWSGLAAWAGVINVFAHLEGPGGEGLGSVGFVVRQGAAGLRQGAEALTMGVRAIVQNTIHLEGVEVGESDMLGEPGEGLAVAQQAMMHGRLAIAASCLGGMRRCAQLMHRYASRRSVAGGLLARNPVALERLGETTAAIAALDALVDRLADTLDRDLPVPDDVYAAVKILAPELLWVAADRLVQMLGGRGYVETNVAPQLLRDARILRIFEGPTEAMCSHLGARIANDESAVVGFLERSLKAPEAARALRESLSQTHDAVHHGDTRTRAMLRHRLGDLAAWAVLAGALESDPAGRDSRAHRWARSALDRSVRALPAPPPEVTFEEVTADIERYAGRVGDVEQSMAGEDASIDPILRRAEPAPGDGEAVAAPRQESVPQRAGRSAAEIEAWLRDWIAANLELTPQEIDPRRPFAELGADSVTAVELVVDLGEFVGQKLDDTLPWEAPSIAAVAERLGSPETPVAAAPPQAPGDARWSDVEASLRELEKRVGRE